MSIQGSTTAECDNFQMENGFSFWKTCHYDVIIKILILEFTIANNYIIHMLTNFYKVFYNTTAQLPYNFTDFQI